jgi:hypothetical protein
MVKLGGENYMDVITIAYLKALEPIGNGIEQTGANFDKISKQFANLPNPTLQDVKDLKRGYNLLLDQFKAIERNLSSLNPSSLLKSGHSKLVATFGQYVEASESAVQAFDETTGEIDKARLDSALNKQRQCSKEIAGITNEMVAEINKVKK